MKLIFLILAVTTFTVTLMANAKVDYANVIVHDTDDVGIVNFDRSTRTWITDGIVIADQFSDGLAPAKKGSGKKFHPRYDSNRYGYIDHNGKFVIPQQFQYAGHFAEGRAIVSNEDGYGVIDRDGKWIVKPGLFQFSAPHGYREGLCPIIQNGGTAFIDLSGKVVIERIDGVLMHSEGFNDDRCPIRSNNAGKRYYINRKGKVIYDDKSFALREITDYSEGLARIEMYVAPGTQSETGYGYINTSGQLVIAPRYRNAGRFREGYAPATYKDQRRIIFASWDQQEIGLDDPEIGKWGFINKAGDFVIERQFDGAGHFSEGKASVLVGDSWGYINKRGEMIIRPQFQSAEEFKNGVAVVHITQDDHLLMAVIDEKGNFVIMPFQPSEDGDYQDAAVTKDSTTEKSLIPASQNTPTISGE